MAASVAQMIVLLVITPFRVISDSSVPVVFILKFPMWKCGYESDSEHQDPS